MNSTAHSKTLICRKCGGRDSVRVLAMSGKYYVCECACGYSYKSKSTAAGAEYMRAKK